MKIGLFFDPPKKIVGCTKVIRNLMAGLKELGHSINVNKYGDLNGCLQGIPPMIKMELKPNVLVGPEILVLPKENPDLFEYYPNWTQPSQWVVDYMSTFKETKGVKFHVWPVGVDTDRWSPKRKRYEYDCFIYYKNVTQQTPRERLKEIENVLQSLKLKYKILEYGHYKEDELYALSQSSRFAIFCTGTESQGIALLETLSCNVPVLIYQDEKTFQYGRYKFNNKNVSSAPYFDERCGSKTLSIPTFINNVKNYSPREYVLENHTFSKGAEKYVKILEKIQN